MPNLKKSNLKRRWIKARPGSVLILVIALLVLLALIGTAYLSSTQTERYTSHQNSINTEADLLITGMQDAVTGQIARAVWGNTTSAGSQYRPAYSEAALPAGTSLPSGLYYNYDSAVPDPTINTALSQSGPDPADVYMADRIPTYNGAPYWKYISWPLFKDSTGSYTFDSPYTPSTSLQTGPAYNRGTLTFTPTSITVNQPDGTQILQPAMTVTTVSGPGGRSFTAPTGATFPTGAFYAASASGDGIADSMFTKVPVGPINGITYYVATRIIDANSAINASTAWTQGVDVIPSGSTSPTTNFGFFRSNIGLYELLNQSISGLPYTRDAEMNVLNGYRYGVAFSGTAPNISTNPPLPVTATQDTTVAAPQPNNYNWYSYGDIFDNVLTRRPGNPGYASTSAYQSQWLGLAQTASLAYKFTLHNSTGSASVIEQMLPNETTNSPTVAYSPASTTQWYQDNFYGMDIYSGATGGSPTGTNVSPTAFPLRSILVGSNAVTNAVPGRYGNASSTTPVQWNASASYNFGDWVIGPDNFSYVCLLPNTGQTPSNTLTTPRAATHTYPQYWEFVPWSAQPVKTSINTANFNQLWLGFCNVMTDTIGTDLNTTTGTTQWQPPIQPSYVGTAPTLGVEPQMPQFSSVLRDPTPKNTPSRMILSSSQMLKLRAAIAAVNTIGLRGGINFTTGANTVTSRHIILADPAAVAPQDHSTKAYDVEVFGNAPNPYISEMVAQIESTPANNYVALELCNPYPFRLVLHNWEFITVNRTNFSGLAGTTGMSGSTPLPFSTPVDIVIPSATDVGGVRTPGMAVVASATTPPSGVTPPPATVSTYVCPTLADAVSQGLEIVLVRPRVYDGGSNAPTTSTDPSDTFTEDPTTAIGCAQMVPVDQLDLTGADALATTLKQADFPARLQYRRGSTPAIAPLASYAWNFIYPGPYDPSVAGTTGRLRMGGIVPETGSKLTPGNLGLPDGTPTATQNIGVTYNTAALEISNVNQAGPNPLSTAGNNTFPWGGFARNGDMLQIPFIGAYCIQARTAAGTRMTAGNFTELNSVTMDSTLSLDTTLLPADAAPQTSPPTASSGEYVEQIGRFCPVGSPDTGTLDFATGANASTNYHYHWAEKLFTYFTVQSPQDDYFPNTDPVRYPGTYPPVPVANNDSSTTNAQIAGKSEDTVGVEGLININTAPAIVLAQLPFYGAATTPPVGMSTVQGNAQIAVAIVKNRDQYGPFKSIFDLYRVPEFRQLNTTMIASEPGPSNGIFSPSGLPTTGGTPVLDNVRYDFQERFLLLNNISNLITTRSDIFTCYVLLQGWRNVGTSNPTLAVQRRVAFLVDRTTLTPANSNPNTFKVPSD